MKKPFLIQKHSVVAALLVAAVASPFALHAQPGPSSGSKADGMDHSASDAKMNMKSMMKENNEKMAAVPMTGNADVDFAQMMRIHHQGAIDMAKSLLRDGKDPQMLKMAKDIISAQKKEIAVLDAFLARNSKAASGSAKTR